MIAGLEGRADPDLPGELAAHPASAGLVVLVDLEAVFAFAARPAMPEQLAEIGQALRYPVQRGAADDQDAEDGQQREQQRRHPRRQRVGQRARDREPDDAARPVQRHSAVGRVRRALGDVEQAGRAEQQRRPADRRAHRLGIAVGMPQEPPGEQRDEHGRHPRQRAERTDHHGLDLAPGRVVHARPQPGGQHDRQPKGEQPDAVPAMMRIQVTRAAPE